MAQKIYLIRHGETEWTLSGQHTGTTDIPLTENGKKDASQLKSRLSGIHFEKVMTSPLMRAQQTCELAGLLKSAYTDPDLTEWNYGEYEGLTTPEIWKKDPGWTPFLRGAPNGESLADIGARTNKVINKIHSCKGNVAIFSHGHFLRALAARWIHLTPADGKSLLLSPSSISILSYEREHPVISLWNDLPCFLKKEPLS